MEWPGQLFARDGSVVGVHPGEERLIDESSLVVARPALQLLHAFEQVNGIPGVYLAE